MVKMKSTTPVKILRTIWHALFVVIMVNISGAYLNLSSVNLLGCS